MMLDCGFITSLEMTELYYAVSEVESHVKVLLSVISKVSWVKRLTCCCDGFVGDGLDDAAMEDVGGVLSENFVH